MPTDVLLLSLAIFTLFAAILAWVDHRTGTWLRAKKAETASSPEAQPAKKAA